MRSGGSITDDNRRCALFVESFVDFAGILIENRAILLEPAAPGHGGHHVHACRRTNYPLNIASGLLFATAAISGLPRVSIIGFLSCSI